MANSRLRTLKQYLDPYRKDVMLGIFSLLLVNGVGVYLPILIRDIVDKFRYAGSFEQVWGKVILIPILASVMWLIRMYSRMILFGVGRQVEFDLKQKIFNHLLKLEPAYYGVNSSGDLISRATSDVDNIRRLVGFALLSIANTFFAYALTLPAMLSIHLRLSVLAISVYPAMLIITQLFSGRLGDAQMQVQENISELSDLIQEDVSGIALVKIYGQEDHERRAFQEKNRRLLKANLRLARTRTILFPLIEGIAFVSLLLLLAVGVGQIEQNVITIGDLIALIIFIERLVFPTALLGFTITAYQRGEVSIDRVEAILRVKPQISDSPDAVALPLQEVKGELKSVDLSYSYPGNSKPALDHLNFWIKPGEMVAIVGSVGAGKSTLANLIPRLVDISSGQLFLDGKDVTKILLADLRRAIAYVPQESFLFSTTIADNICYGKPEATTEAIEAAAKTAQIHGEILNFPQQYQTIVGERGITLSGGQRQRTALARAILVDAPVLILDDALSSVDNQTATEILRNLSSTQDKTVLFITHQLSASLIADRLLVMDQGKIVQSGTHEELLGTPGLYQNLWRQHQLEKMVN